MIHVWRWFIPHTSCSGPQLPVLSCCCCCHIFPAEVQLPQVVCTAGLHIYRGFLVSPWCVAKSFHLPLVSLLGILLSLSVIRVMVPPSEWPALQCTHQLLKYRSPYDFIVGCLFLSDTPIILRFHPWCNAASYFIWLKPLNARIWTLTGVNWRRKGLVTRQFMRLVDILKAMLILILPLCRH